MVILNVGRYGLQPLTLDRIGKDSPDGAMIRELSVSDRVLTKYEVAIHTGNLDNAGTDANVVISLLGNRVC